MAEYVYPAVFHPNDDGSFTITYPDLPGCVSEGKSLGNAMYMAQSALTQWIEYLTDKKQDVPMASGLGSLETEPGEFVNLIRADIKDGRAVKRTVSIPKWMDDKVAETGLSLSRVLQDALKERLNVG
ncbi:type II toxin-antitoxin system HicB family antitoxin [uncultured Acetatifactor sp.]|jgi:predicted RNase H-like HicB family nuclease|uniref:type II toxin-antitoxin system HicB family antitoxin n=1 Tax=uncultured Acetatifactor sp. TaxID=1671927 RepID=UPI00262BD0C2|nr:type II toxin-antitoxin system HicB family antitoxin [uncultured Acetatifactor sp.]